MRPNRTKREFLCTESDVITLNLQSNAVTIEKERNTLRPLKRIITRNSSHIASRIPHVNQMELKKWLPDVVNKCMGSKIKYQFLAVQINSSLCANLSLINNMQLHYEAKAFSQFR